MSSRPEDQLSPWESNPPTTTVPNIHASQPPPPSEEDNKKYGTHIMGALAAPNVHPDNQKADLWNAEDHQQIPQQPLETQPQQPPYVQYSPINKPTNNPFEPVINLFNSWGNKAETIARNIWHNLKTGPSVSEAAWGKLNLTAKAVTEGGFEALFKQIFGTDPNEKLKKTFACYLSTSTGPYIKTTSFHQKFGSVGRFGSFRIDDDEFDLFLKALLYAVGLGKGAIPTAAALNWVLKDGIGYLSKIMLSKYGRHFDMLTPVFPNHFLLIGAAAGAGRSAAALIQAATRSCFYAGFAAQRNFAEVIAKGEAQGMVSKFIGIGLGIALANQIGSSTSLGLASFSLVTCIHMFCNLKSYQAIQLRTLNPYRASLVFSEYLLSGQAPPVKDVNEEEPLFPAVPFLNWKPANKGQTTVLSSEAKDAAAEIEQRLQLGSKLSDLINNKEDVHALFNLYKEEGYILTEHRGRYCVVLKETSSLQDMLRALFHVNYLYWLEKNAGIEAKGTSIDCRPGGRLEMSLDYVWREFDIVKTDGESVGWVTDGLIARPAHNRIRPVYEASSVAC
ncbi:hypothetical protein ACLB2K_018601 [Fragaria x ananassa]